MRNKLRKKYDKSYNIRKWHSGNFGNFWSTLAWSNVQRVIGSADRKRSETKVLGKLRKFNHALRIIFNWLISSFKSFWQVEVFYLDLKR